MNFVVNDGKVPYIMVAGSDHVSGEMPLADAQRIHDTGARRIRSNRFKGYPVCVDNRFFFAGVSAAKSDADKTREKVEES